MKTDIYNQEGTVTGTMELPAAVFGAKWNPDLVQQALVAYLGNRRQPLAHTKDRSEVAGGGKKPWRQKHTGRARHGSSRSPLWSGGGITFGPRNDRDFSKKLNKKMKYAALISLLSKKMTDGEVKIVDHLTIPDHKTKHVAGIVKRLFSGPASVLIVTVRGNSNVVRSGRNLPKVQIIDAHEVNVPDVLEHKHFLIESKAVEFLARKPARA